MPRSDPNDATENIVLPSLLLEKPEKLEEVDLPIKSELLIPASEETDEGGRMKNMELPLKSPTTNESQNRSPLQPKIDRPISQRFTDKASVISPSKPQIDRPISQKFIDEASSINLMNISTRGLSPGFSLDNNLGNKIFKLDCSTNKVFMSTNLKFDKNSKLFCCCCCCW